MNITRRVFLQSAAAIAATLLLPVNVAPSLADPTEPLEIASVMPEGAIDCLIRLDNRIMYRASSAFPFLPPEFAISIQVKDGMTCVYMDQCLLGVVSEEMKEPVPVEFTFVGLEVSDNGLVTQTFIEPGCNYGRG